MVTPPSFRPDLPREIDLIEEVLRLWGMGRVTATIPAAKNHIGGLTREQKLTRKVGEILRACGLNETTTFGFAAPGDLEKIGMSTEGRGCPVVLMNPLVAEQTEMRRSLLPGLLQSVATTRPTARPTCTCTRSAACSTAARTLACPRRPSPWRVCSRASG